MTTLKKGTRLYHITKGDIPQLKKIPTYFALTPLNAICMAPVNKPNSIDDRGSRETWASNLNNNLYALTLTEDTTFFIDKGWSVNSIGMYTGNTTALRLTEYGYRVQELVVSDPTKHRWEMVTETAGVMPSVQLFLAKYPMWSELEKPLKLKGRRVYHFYEYQWKQMETNFKMKTLEEVDEAQKISIENASYWEGVNKEEKGKEIEAFTNARMSVKQQLGSWEEFSREKSKYVKLHKAGSMVPKHLLLDVQSPKEYVVITKNITSYIKVSSLAGYVAKLKEYNLKIKYVKDLIRDIEEQYDYDHDNMDDETKKSLEKLEDEKDKLKLERGILRMEEKKRKAVARRAMKSVILKLKF